MFSDKWYLVWRIWDILQIMYLFSYLNVYWGTAVGFVWMGLGVSWGKLGRLVVGRFVYSGERVVAVAGDMHLGANLLSNLAIVAGLFLIFGIVWLIKLVSRYYNKTKK